MAQRSLLPGMEIKLQNQRTLAPFELIEIKHLLSQASQGLRVINKKYSLFSPRKRGVPGLGPNGLNFQ